jgi:hypothetical protein
MSKTHYHGDMSAYDIADYILSNTPNNKPIYMPTHEILTALLVPVVRAFKDTRKTYTIDEIAEYIAGWTTGPFEDVEDMSQATLRNAINMLRDDQDGIDACKNRGALGTGESDSDDTCAPSSNDKYYSERSRITKLERAEAIKFACALSWRNAIANEHHGKVAAIKLLRYLTQDNLGNKPGLGDSKFTVETWFGENGERVDLFIMKYRENEKKTYLKVSPKMVI